MATSNFPIVNTSKIYAIEASELEHDDWYYDDIKQNIVDDFIENDAYVTEYYVSDGTYLCTLRVTKEWTDYEASLEAHIVLKSGYYSGACLDFELEDDYSSCLSFKEEERVEKFLLEAKAKLQSKIEKIFKRHSTPLQVKTRFSNGETIYQRA